MISLDSFKPYEAELLDTYKQLHRNPELAYEEHRTSALVAERLKAWGLKVTESLAVTGVMGELDSGKPGKTLLLRADMDALPVNEDTGCDYPSKIPGIMHACGHDGHVSMLLTAAHYLADRKNLFTGKIRFLFQPAEEGVSGEKAEEIMKLGYGTNDAAQIMIRQGVLEGVDGCMAIHVSPKKPGGSVLISKQAAMSAADAFHCQLTGTGGHGSAPHAASDPVSALSAAISAIQGIPARSVSALDRAVVNIGVIETPGSRYNIIPSKVRFSGTVRTFDEAVREKVAGEEIPQKLGSAAALYGCEADYTRVKGYDAVINDEAMSRLAAEVAGDAMGKENVEYTDRPDMASEDVGYYFQKVPGVLVWLGVGAGCEPNPAPLHSPHMLPDPAALLWGVAFHSAFAMEFLRRDSL